MKRFALLALLALPLTAFANSIDTTNSGGKLAGSAAGMTLSGSLLIAVNGINNMLVTGNDLGSVALSTGTLSSGSLQMGGTFNGGGSFVITSLGASGLPSGTLFNGSFTGQSGDSFTATVDYGEGAGPQPLTLTGNAFTLSHAYAEGGSYSVSVVVTDTLPPFRSKLPPGPFKFARK